MYVGTDFGPRKIVVDVSNWKSKEVNLHGCAEFPKGGGGLGIILRCVPLLTTSPSSLGKRDEFLKRGGRSALVTVRSYIILVLAPRWQAGEAKLCQRPAEILGPHRLFFLPFSWIHSIFRMAYEILKWRGCLVISYLEIAQILYTINNSLSPFFGYSRRHVRPQV